MFFEDFCDVLNRQMEIQTPERVFLDENGNKQELNFSSVYPPGN